MGFTNELNLWIIHSPAIVAEQRLTGRILKTACG